MSHSRKKIIGEVWLKILKGVIEIAFILAFPPKMWSHTRRIFGGNYFQKMTKLKICDACNLDFPKICVALLRSRRLMEFPQKSQGLKGVMQWCENASFLRNDAIEFKYHYWGADAMVCECTTSIFSLLAGIHIDAHWRLTVACCCTHFLAFFLQKSLKSTTLLST